MKGNKASNILCRYAQLSSVLIHKQAHLFLVISNNMEDTAWHGDIDRVYHTLKTIKMSAKTYVNAFFISISLIAPLTAVIRSQAQDAVALRLVQTIPLPNVEGRIDHMSVDIKGQRLLIAALGNNCSSLLPLKLSRPCG